MCSRLEREASRQEDTRTVPVESRCLMMRLMRQQIAVATGKPSAAAGKISTVSALLECCCQVLPTAAVICRYSKLHIYIGFESKNSTKLSSSN